MRIGIMTTAAPHDLDRAARLGLRAFEWVRFADSPAGPAHTDWEPYAEQVAAASAARRLRITAIAALYANPLDPRQTEFARAAFRRAIQVAAHLRVRTVAGFAGAVIETKTNERGGNPVYQPFEDHLAPFLAFWEPLADYAADSGVRLAFENCPQGPYHLPLMGFNMMDRPALWERVFNATRCENLGLEWDPSHLICQFIDPVDNIRRFGARIFHVHAKDAWVDQPLLARYGICHPGATEHRFPGLGQVDWAQIVHALLRAGYDSDLTLEGWHDPVYRDHPEPPPGRAPGAPAIPLAGQKLEEAGLLIARQTLERYLPPEPEPAAPEV